MLYSSKIQLLMEYARRHIQSSAERNRDAAEIREYLIEIQTGRNLPSNPQVVPTVLERLEIPPTTEAGPSSTSSDCKHEDLLGRFPLISVM